ncbi:TPA: hypothetical protein ON228_003920, partial [Escherichia coli]|nr:hypothetical protein [Escherichia coli]
DIHQKTRDDFFEALTAFAGCLKVALQSATFFTDKSFTEQDRNLYKETALLNNRESCCFSMSDLVKYAH